MVGNNKKKTKSLSAVIKRREIDIEIFGKEKKWSVTFSKGLRRTKKGKRLGRFRIQGCYTYYMYIALFFFSYIYIYIMCFFFFINLLTGRAPKQVSNAA